MTRPWWELVDATRWRDWTDAELDAYERTTGTRLERASERVAVYADGRTVCEVVVPVGREETTT